jgi:hypothetical protein
MVIDVISKLAILFTGIVFIISWMRSKYSEVFGDSTKYLEHFLGFLCASRSCSIQAIDVIILDVFYVNACFLCGFYEI